MLQVVTIILCCLLLAVPQEASAVARLKGWSPKQLHLASTIVREGQRQGSSPMEILSAIATGIVETRLTNPRGGHGTSAGWRQEIDTYGSVARRTNVRGAARRYFGETAKVKSKYSNAGRLAQAVQRSAYPDRYGKALPQARQIVRALSTGADPDAGISYVTQRTPASVQTDLAGAMRQALMSGDHNVLLNAFSLVKSGDFTTVTPGRSVTRQVRADSGGASAGAGRIARLVSRANRVDRAAPRYKWGGGHGARPAALGVPVDCSGAVSQILGVRPVVSGDFGRYLKKGRGRVNVYYNKGHVLMEIDGKFFGTSASNPGGGAGWIPRSKVNKRYLSGFKVGHVL